MPFIVLIPALQLDLVSLTQENYPDGQLHHLCKTVSYHDEDFGPTEIEPIYGVGTNPDVDLDFDQEYDYLEVDSTIQMITDSLNNSLMSGQDIAQVLIDFSEDSHTSDVEEIREVLTSSFPHIEFIIGVG